MRLTKTGLYTLYLLVFVFLLSGTILFNGCTNTETIDNTFKPTGDTIADGKKLVAMYCTKCHQLVPPDALNKDVWKFHALPAMSHYLGLSTYGTSYFKRTLDTSGVSLTNWQIIQDYYAKLAPVELPASKPPVPLINDWAGFSLQKPHEDKNIVYTTMVAVDQSAGKIYSSDVLSGKLVEWDKALKSRDIAQLPSAGVDANFTKDDAGTPVAIVSSIGEIEPMDFPNGKLVKIRLNQKEEITIPGVLASELPRPVQSVMGDFNKDGLSDWVVCAQGDKAGLVYLLTQKADHSYSQSTIIKKAGAVQARVGDFNNDGWPDLMILFGSHDEGLWLFLNDRKGGFASRNLLHFPPVYGSTSFQLADINHDGKLDLIYTCGYNYRDSRIMKPYHGLYIFTNQGDWNFKQSYFYPINGCTKAIATDFDGDGDIDIATIAFFADLKNRPDEGFIYFEQDKAMSFKPHAVPVSNYGRWMSMDTISNPKGRPDIVLGNYAMGLSIYPGLKPFWNMHLPIVVLRNHAKK
jgi:hypothetical protein